MQPKYVQQRYVNQVLVVSSREPLRLDLGKEVI